MSKKARALKDKENKSNLKNLAPTTNKKRKRDEIAEDSEEEVESPVQRKSPKKKALPKKKQAGGEVGDSDSEY